MVWPVCRWLHIWSVAWVLGGFAAVAGCTGDTSVDETLFEEQYLAIGCARSSECSEGEESFDPFQTGRECTEVLTGLRAIWLAERSGRMQFEPGPAQACLDALATLDCDATNYVALPMLRSCGQAYSGLVQAGGECLADIECAGESWCQMDLSCPGHCVPVTPLGQPCSHWRDCGEETCFNGVCTSRLSLEAACGVSLPPCALGLECDAAGTSTCVERVRQETLPLGAACDGQEALCRPELYCDFSSSPSACQPKSGVGATNCFEVPCQDELFCRFSVGASTCVAKGLIGAACESGEECEQGACVAGSCRYRLLPGETCADSNECVTDYCDPASRRCAALPPCQAVAEPEPAPAMAAPLPAGGTPTSVPRVAPAPAPSGT